MGRMGGTTAGQRSGEGAGHKKRCKCVNVELSARWTWDVPVSVRKLCIRVDVGVMGADPFCSGSCLRLRSRWWHRRGCVADIGITVANLA